MFFCKSEGLSNHAKDAYLAQMTQVASTALLSPRWMRVVADFTVRGNIKTIVFAEDATPQYQGPRPEYRRYLQV